MWISYRILCNIKKINAFNFKHKEFLKGNVIKKFNHNLAPNNTQLLTNNLEWTPVYRYKPIFIAGILNRFKLYQTVVSFAAIPASSILYSYGFVEFTIVKVFIGCGVIASLTLYPITWFFRKLIGIIYVSKDNKNVKISHLTFWGRRKDIVVPTENIVPLLDCEYNTKDAYVRLQRYDISDVLFFTLKYGEVLHREKFQYVFGDLKLLGYSDNKT